MKGDATGKLFTWATSARHKSPTSGHRRNTGQIVRLVMLVGSLVPEAFALHPVTCLASSRDGFGRQDQGLPSGKEGPKLKVTAFVDADDFRLS